MNLRHSHDIDIYFDIYPLYLTTNCMEMPAYSRLLLLSYSDWHLGVYKDAREAAATEATIAAEADDEVHSETLHIFDNNYYYFFVVTGKTRINSFKYEMEKSHIFSQKLCIQQGPEVLANNRIGKHIRHIDIYQWTKELNSEMFAN